MARYKGVPARATILGLDMDMSMPGLEIGDGRRKRNVTPMKRRIILIIFAVIVALLATLIYTRPPFFVGFLSSEGPQYIWSACRLVWRWLSNVGLTVWKWILTIV